MKRRAEYAFDETDTSEDETLSQSGGALTDGPLFDFNFVPVGPCHRWRGVVERTQYHAELQQLRAPTGDDNIGQSLAGALDRAVVQQLMDQQRPDHDLVNLAVAADEFQHVFGSVNFHVGELFEDGQQFDMFLQCLAQSLNSNETFDSNQGFQVDMVLVRMASQGAGRRKNNPGRLCLDCENKKKMHYSHS